MAYNITHLPTAGKVTVYTTLLSVVVFLVIFLFNLGEAEIRLADAGSSATTSVTVVNTPPQWTVDAQEATPSSTTTPTNAGDVISWVATGTDSNGEDYYLLICSTAATPTANVSAAPTCGIGSIQWAVSTSTISGTQATAATTTYAALPEVNNWYAFICDDNSGTPRCNNSPRQGTEPTASPFEVNHRPSFSVFTDTSPAVPGATVVFQSTSSDSDTSGAPDTVRLIVCSTSGFNTATDTCTDTTLASSSVFVAANASSTYTISIPTQDQNYSAFGFVVDNHGFEAAGGAQGTDSVLTVQNVAPTVSGSSIQINGGSDMTLTVESGQTTGFTLRFTTSDNNSCVNASATPEVTNYQLALYRSGLTPSGCTATSTFNANNCYPSTVASTTWNLTCTASSTSCAGPTDSDQVWDCTFPLWYVADPTDGTSTSTLFFADDWRAQVIAVDDNFATSSYGTSTLGVEVRSFLAFALNTIQIPYGSLEPGQQTDPLNATTTISATGNVGLDKDVIGTAMCTSYTNSTPCPNSSTSTIPAEEQRFATSTVAYGSAFAISSTTPTQIEINVPKSTSTVIQASRSAYWGIRVPGSVSFAGIYYGQNVFTARVSEPGEW